MKKHILTVAAAAGILFTSFGGLVSAHENKNNPYWKPRYLGARTAF